MGIIDDIKTLTGQKKPPAHHKKPTGPAKKVLIVEDEKVLAERLQTELKEAGFTTVSAANGEEGLALVQSEKPDVVILDLLMPVMDGITMLGKMRNIPDFKKLPVIVLTNAGEIENIRQTQTFYSADEFMIKANVTVEQIVKKAKILAGIMQTFKTT